MNDKMREAFEREASRCGLSLGKQGANDYVDEATSKAWHIVQALTQQPESEPVMFTCHGNSAPAYSCNKPGDMSGTYYRSPQPTPQVPDVYKNLYEKANRLIAQVGFAGEIDSRANEVSQLLSAMEEIDANGLCPMDPSIAEERKWVNCEKRLPRPSDGDGSSNVWVIDRDGVIEVKHWRYVVSHGAALYTHWMSTGLRRPEPPAGGEV